jgi:hypothetical protein
MRSGGKNKLNEEKLVEGYKALAQENKEFAALVSEIAHEVLPEWE